MNSDVAVIRDSTCVAASVKQPKQIPKGKSQANTVSKRNKLRQHAVKQLGIAEGSNMYVSLLGAINYVQALKQVHVHMFRTGLNQTRYLVNKLVDMYCICGNMEIARLVFDSIPDRNGFLWNVMIKRYATNEPFDETLVLCCQMQEEGLQPDKYTFAFLLKASASLIAPQEGKQIHNRIIRYGLESDVFVGTSLIDMYAKCGLMEFARQCLTKFPREM